MSDPTDYKVEYSYLVHGFRVRMIDTFFDESAQGASQQCERCYGAADSFRIEKVWKLIPSHWVEMSID